MLYSNFHIPIAHRQTPEGNFNGAVIGQFQTGACRFYLEAPRKVGRFIKGSGPTFLSPVTCHAPIATSGASRKPPPVVPTLSSPRVAPMGGISVPAISWRRPSSP